MNVFQMVRYAIAKHGWTRIAIYLAIIDVAGFILYRVVWWQFIPIVAFFDFLIVVFWSLNVYLSGERKEKTKQEYGTSNALNR